jgi:hypothetical protein
MKMLSIKYVQWMKRHKIELISAYFLVLIGLLVVIYYIRNVTLASKDQFDKSVPELTQEQIDKWDMMQQRIQVWENDQSIMSMRNSDFSLDFQLGSSMHSSGNPSCYLGLWGPHNSYDLPSLYDQYLFPEDNFSTFASHYLDSSKIDMLYLPDSIWEKLRKEYYDTRKYNYAILGYSNPKILNRGEVKYINVFVHPSLSTEQIANKLSEINFNQTRNEDSVSLFTQNVKFLKGLDISLIDPEGTFKITKIHDSSFQNVNNREGNKWIWGISTLTNKVSAELILKVKATMPDDETLSFEDHYIPIIIELGNESFFRKTWIYFADHPEYIWGAFLLPCFGYFGKKMFEWRRKEKPRKLY